jgi:ketol-acid reductoisomerase
MDAKRYAEILKSVLRMQVVERMKEIQMGSYATEYMEGYEEGIVKGLEIAMEKIEKSSFLFE